VKGLGANNLRHERNGKGLITPDRPTFIEPWVTKIIQNCRQAMLLEAMKKDGLPEIELLK